MRMSTKLWLGMKVVGAAGEPEILNDSLENIMKPLVEFLLKNPMLKRIQISLAPTQEDCLRGLATERKKPESQSSINEDEAMKILAALQETAKNLESSDDFVD